MLSYYLVRMVTFAGKKLPSFLHGEAVEKPMLTKQTSMLQLRFALLTDYYMNVQTGC